MMWLKSCPKCNGDLYEEPAIGELSISGALVICLQCGHLLSNEEEMLLPGRERPRPRPRRVRVA